MIILLKREREGEREGERKKKEGGETRALSVPNIRFNSNIWHKWMCAFGNGSEIKSVAPCRLPMFSKYMKL